MSNHFLRKHSILYWALFALFFVACKSELPQTKVLCLGHGGMGIKSRFPLDSRSSILECLNQGADGVEIDVQMSKDGILFAFHDADLSERTDGQGLIHDFSANEISAINYKGLFSRKEPIQRLDSIFNLLSDFPEAIVTFDVKLYTSSSYTPYQQTVAESIANFIQQNSRKKPILVESQDTSFLNYFHQLSPFSPTYFYTSIFDDGFKALNTFNYHGLTMDLQNINKEQIETLHAGNFKISLWNVQTVGENSDALQLNPDYIQTDEINDLLQKTR